MKKKLIIIIYILIAFTSIGVINKYETTLPIIDLEAEEKQDNIDFTVISIYKNDIEETDKKEYIYKVKIDSNYTVTNYTNISAKILNDLRGEEDFLKLNLIIVDVEGNELFKFTN